MKKLKEWLPKRLGAADAIKILAGAVIVVLLIQIIWLNIWLYSLVMAVLLLLSFAAYKYAHAKFYNSLNQIEEGVSMIDYGWFLPPWFTQFVVRPLVAGIGAVMITTIVLIVVRLALKDTSLQENLHLTIWGTLALAVAVGWGDDSGGNRNVPNGHVGILTFLDNRLDVFLSEGKHKWLPEFLFFGVNSEALYGTKNKSGSVTGPEQGFVFVQPDTLDIWDDREKKNGVPNRTLESITKAGSSIFTSFTIIIKVNKPLVYSNINDPILRIAEQSRAALRKTLAYFHDLDITSLKDTIVTITKGDTVYVAFTTDRVGIFPEGSVARDRGGNMLVRHVASRKKGETKKSFKKRCQKAKKDLEKDVQDQKKIAEAFAGICHVTKISLLEQIKPTVEASGATFIASVLANVTLSDVVSNTAKEAAALGQRAKISAELAEMQVKAIEQMEDAKATDMNRALAALQANLPGVNIVANVGRGDSLTQAAATIATTLGNSGKGDSAKGGKTS